VKGEGKVFASDWGPGSAAKRFFLLRCVRTNPQANVEQGLQCQKADSGHVCNRADVSEFFASSDKHQYEVVRGELPARLFLDVEWTATLEHVDGSGHLGVI
jgi:hypothetical protein